MNCILTGVGGQGTVLASKLIASTALENGLMVRTAETIGMAQRGGCVVSHVRTGEHIYSPLISYGQADIIIGFEPAEAVRCLPYLKEGGTVVVSNRGMQPVTAALSNYAYDGSEMMEYLRTHVANLIEIDGETICGEIGSVKALNTVLLGAALTSNTLGITKEQLVHSIERTLAEKYVAMNLNALDAGINAAS
ncbi:MAG: indolepyruvate oxidoreductase subunit beta [Eubacteriales bacterium]